MSYIDKVEIRNSENFYTSELPDDSNWMWTIDDYGSWDGPLRDWLQHHSQKYFEHVKKKDVILTAGANHGMYAKFYSKMFQTVYAFEPDPLNFFCLVNNVQADNVVKIQAALGSEPGFCKIDRKWGIDETGTIRNSGAYHIDDKQTGIIPIMTIDSFNFKVLDVIQLDVEDYEAHVLIGARKTIKRLKPLIILECGFDGKEGIFREMEKLNYTLVNTSSADTIWLPKDKKS